MRKMNEYEYEIYDLIRNAFHSQSGFFLNKQESYDIMLKVKQLFEAREESIEVALKATEQGTQYCNYCKKETFHTPKLGLVFENKRLCSVCSTSNAIEE